MCIVIFLATSHGVFTYERDGETWRLCEGSTGDPSLEALPAPLIYPDVHSIETHPSSPDLAFAPTGGGYYASSDGGKSWELLYDCYCRAVWIDPGDASHQVLGPADGVSRNGRIEETRDGGRSWRAAFTGLNAPWSRYMVERFTQIGPELFAVLSNGELLSTTIDALRWQRVLPDCTEIAAIARMAE